MNRCRGREEQEEEENRGREKTKGRKKKNHPKFFILGTLLTEFILNSIDWASPRKNMTQFFYVNNPTILFHLTGSLVHSILCKTIFFYTRTSSSISFYPYLPKKKFTPFKFPNENLHFCVKKHTSHSPIKFPNLRD